MYGEWGVGRSATRSANAATALCLAPHQTYRISVRCGTTRTRSPCGPRPPLSAGFPLLKQASDTVLPRYRACSSARAVLCPRARPSSLVQQCTRTTSCACESKQIPSARRWSSLRTALRVLWADSPAAATQQAALPPLECRRWRASRRCRSAGLPSTLPWHTSLTACHHRFPPLQQ